MDIFLFYVLCANVPLIHAAYSFIITIDQLLEYTITYFVIIHL